MGAWGANSFDNDDAQDWLTDFADEPSIAAIKEALSAVTDLDAEEYLELPECGAALAAAEVVAAMRGAPATELPTEISQWVRKRKSPVSASLVSLAIKALSRIRTHSEMQELWLESASGQQWQSEIKSLETRLFQASA